MSINRIRIVPYKMTSATANALQTWLRANLPDGAQRSVLRVRTDGRYAPLDDDMLINWGCNSLPEKFGGVGLLLNHPDIVARASNKSAAFAVFKEAGVSTLETTSDPAVADTWLADGEVVVARRLLRASGGRGIELCTPEGMDRVVKAPLYTKYIKKAAEYRVHVLPNGSIILNQKRRKADVPDDEVDWKIRNHDRGWIMARDNVDPCPAAEAEAVKAIEALGLNFGAVDVIYNAHRDAAYVLEVNTAPGLEGSLVDAYGQALIEVMLQN